ncbi:MAG: ChaN family lipoprotein [Candidatus Thiodiazotropha sp. (ex Epidulcina cf. delphinae)]|nr:ChaN family lipoprotein [Candidatus Thiodiazotropha sp. (ex Epidulcina cf. delphinae)]
MLPNHLAFIILACMLTMVNAEEESTNAVVDLSALIDVSSLVEKIADRQVVFVGESHDQYQHHLNQLAIIKGLHAHQSDLAIGLEFFFQPFQHVLDRYIAGEIDEPDLIRESEYFTRWRFDFRLYRPIFRYAREHGIPLIALNLESEITKQVGREGIESLSEELKQRLPSEIDRENESYRKRIQAIFDSHPHMKGRDFEHFFDAQLLWDEGMAQRAAEWMNEHPGRQLVILAGVGHLIYGGGIPDRLSRRVSSSRAVVLNLSVLSGLDPEMADFLILADQQALPPSGKLGVMLDLSDDRPRVSGFVSGSGAADAGVEKNDRLLSIDGQPVNSYADIRIALMDKAVGESIDLEVERERLILGITAETFQVTLR